MRIVIDMQGAQTESRFRGIGRYTMSFALAVARNRGDHEVLLALNGLFPDTIEPIRAVFDGILPQENIRIWHAPGPVMAQVPENEARRKVAELIREAFLANLQPDIIHICSLFEGYIDDAVTSIAQFDKHTPVSVTLHDLIPLLNPEQYLKPNPNYARYYQRKVEQLHHATHCLCISEFSKQEGQQYLSLPDSHFTNVSEGVEAEFHPQQIDQTTQQQIYQKLGIARPFILYAGGTDERKNLPRLIQAYAALPQTLRTKHQLIFAGKMPNDAVYTFQRLAKSLGLDDDELHFTGYVSDEELIQLYNLCHLFAFPSWHEGFGLPALEAMACGTAVIGANSSSLPEVIGLDEALFDPHDTSSITTKMRQVLENEVFRNRLKEHGLRQATCFSWNTTAKQAIAVWESLQTPSTSQNYLENSLTEARLYQALSKNITAEPNKTNLIELSAALAQNQQNGIERQLLLDVSELCQHDAGTGVQRVVRNYLRWLLQSPPANFRAEPVYATRQEGYRYARRYTHSLLELNEADVSDNPIRWQRGDIFFGLDMQHHVQLKHRAFYQDLRQDGVSVKFLIHDLLPIQYADFFKDSDAKALHEQWLTMIAGTDTGICVSKATADAFEQWLRENHHPQSPTFQITWVHNGGDIENTHSSPNLPQKASEVLNKIRVRPSFLCVATLEPRKKQQQILEAIQQLWADEVDINLVLVGQQGWKIEALATRLLHHPEQNQRLFWLQSISDEYLEEIYTSSTCLIAASINEGFGLPLIEAAHHQLPIIARDIPVFREIAGNGAYYFQGDTANDLANAIKSWLSLYQQQQHPKSDTISWSTWQESSKKLKAILVSENYRRHQILVDISELVQHDAKTGIQRVVRNILKVWLGQPPAKYAIEPVYATTEHGYRYARCFTANFLNTFAPVSALNDEAITYRAGDIFFALDMQPQVQVAHRGFYQALRNQGVRVEFLIHDLLSIRMPQYFPPGTAKGLTQWLEVVHESDGAVCVSKTVANELLQWTNNRTTTTKRRPFRISWSHNGADIDEYIPASKTGPDSIQTLEYLRSRISFLMVGTLEPRKGHAQVLEAFDQLWQMGTEANLVIVGKKGWLVKDISANIYNHPEFNKRLFWLDSIDDEYLEQVYSASTCLIAASYGEGFGLPLIEAAKHKLPIIARDLPVFREIALEHAYYFDARTTDELTTVITTWIQLFQTDQYPKPDKIHWLTWKESSYRLLNILLEHTA